MNDHQCTALVAAVLMSSPNSTWAQDNPKARERAIDAAARLVIESKVRVAELTAALPGDKP